MVDALEELKLDEFVEAVAEGLGTVEDIFVWGFVNAAMLAARVPSSSRLKVKELLQHSAVPSAGSPQGMPHGCGALGGEPESVEISYAKPAPLFVGMWPPRSGDAPSLSK